jgi:uncharacterized membrane protein YbhN (UPF0104 family)
VGVNALVPARGGDVLRLYLIKHRIEGAAYTTLATTLVVETLLDVVLASALLLWALQQGVLPGVDVLPRLPEVDWLWLFQHPMVAAAVGAAALLAGFGLGLWASRRIELLRQRFRQGFAVLRPPRRYLRGVVPWQALDWGCRLTSVYFFLHAFGIAANLHNALLVQVTNSLSTVLPLTPAGIGTEQALLVYVFAGAASATAVLSLSVGMKFIVIAANAAVGFLAAALMLRTFRWRRAVARAVADRQNSGEASDRPRPSLRGTRPIAHSCIAAGFPPSPRAAPSSLRSLPAQLLERRSA